MSKLLQVKITLVGTAPPVWRRIVIPGHLTLRQAHVILHKAMDWKERGSYRFRQDGREFGNPALHSDYLEDDSTYRLSYCLCLPGHVVEYAFGAWKHSIVLESIETGKAVAWHLIAGEGHCPPARGLGYESARSRPMLH